MRNKLAIAAILVPLIALALWAQTVRPTRISMPRLTPLATEPGICTTGDFYYNSTTGQMTLCGTMGLATQNANNIRKCELFVGADAGAKIVACIADLPATGGIADARGLEGAQVISTTITVNKPVAILLGYATYTTSASPAFDFVGAGDFSSLIGVGIGNTGGVGGTEITAASSGVTPLIRVAGSSGADRVVRIRLEHFQLNGTSTLDLQTGISYNFFTDIGLTNVLFNELGQAEDIDAGALIYHDRVSYNRCGTGDTPATACVRVENRSDPGGTQLNQIRWNRSLWQGHEASPFDRQGTAIYFNDVEASTMWVTNSFFEFNNNADFRIVVFENTQFAIFCNNTVSANTITVAAAVVDVTGDVTDRAASIQLCNNRISFSNTVPAIRLDWGKQNTVVGGVFRGNGSGTAVLITANHQSGTVGPFEMASADTPVSNSSTAVVTFFREQTSGNAWYMPEGLAVGATPAITGTIRLSQVDSIRWRNTADSANLTVIGVNTNDDIVLGDTAGTEVRILGQLSVGNIAPQATGIVIPNNEQYQTLNNAATAPITVAKVSSSDVLEIGNDSDLAGTLVNPLEGTLTNFPHWIFKQVDFGDMTAAATADTFTLWTLPANTMIHDVVGTVVTGWSGGSISAAVCSVGTNAGSANDLTLDDDFFAAATVYELHDATANGGKGTLLFDATDRFAPSMFVAGGVVEIQCDLTGDNHANATAGQARIYILVSQPLANTATEAN